MTDKKVDFLIADFNATKAEIGRRSNLQKASVLGIFWAYSFAFKYVLEEGHSVEMTGFVLLVAIMHYIYYSRESSEISRLGEFVRVIANKGSKLLESSADDIHVSELFTGSQDCKNECKDYCFKILLYFGIPLYFVVNLMYIYL